MLVTSGMETVKGLRSKTGGLSFTSCRVMITLLYDLLGESALSRASTVRLYSLGGVSKSNPVEFVYISPVSSLM